MKQVFTLLIGFLLAEASFAQLVEVRSTSGGALVNGTVVQVTGHSGETSIDKTLYTTLTGATSKDVNMRRYELNVQSGTNNTYCWAVCPASAPAGANPVWVSPVHIPMSPGVEYNSFKGSHEPNGLTGTSTYRYVWYDMNNPTDTVYVDIEYTVGTLGAEEHKRIAAIEVLNTVGELTLSVNTTYANSVIQVYDVIGNLITTQRIGQGKQVVHVDMFVNAGIYFVSLNGNGERLVSRKVLFK